MELGEANVDRENSEVSKRYPEVQSNDDEDSEQQRSS